MRSNNREDIEVAFKALATAVEAVLELDFEALATPERLTYLRRCETARRRLPAVEHPLINQLAAWATPAELDGTLRCKLADELRITRAEANRRINDAALLGPRQSLTGEPLAPLHPATAAGQRHGQIGDAHIRVIQEFFHRLPDSVSAAETEQAESELASYATEFRPDELMKLAVAKFDQLVPDGLFTDVERARRRSLAIGPQDSAGMSSIKGWLDPQARATIDAVLAKLAAPGMCNPADETPCLSGTPSQEAIDNDTRSTGQRNHDGLTAMGRALLASGDLGQHNGLPASIIVSVSLAELEAGAGKAITGGGSSLPIKDLIRLASHAHQYLRVFHGAKELALFHTRRIASPAQRLVLYARDRGCSHPGCSVPGYFCEAHHGTDYALKPETDVNDLTWRCGPHHKIITPGGWSTRKRADGIIETIPPAHLDRDQPRTNSYHHPERLLLREGRDDDTDP